MEAFGEAAAQTDLGVTGPSGHPHIPNASTIRTSETPARERPLPGNLGADSDRLQLAGKRPSADGRGLNGNPSNWTPPRSDLGLFRDLQRIVDLDAEVSNRAFELRVAKKQLNSPEVLRATVD